MIRIPMPTIVLPGDGRLAIYPTVKTRYPGPGFGIGAGVRPVPSHTDWKANQQVMGMPHPLGGMSLRVAKQELMSGPLAWGCGMGLDGTAASYRRYTGLGG